MDALVLAITISAYVKYAVTAGTTPSMVHEAGLVGFIGALLTFFFLLHGGSYEAATLDAFAVLRQVPPAVAAGVLALMACSSYMMKFTGVRALPALIWAVCCAMALSSARVVIILIIGQLRRKGHFVKHIAVFSEGDFGARFTNNLRRKALPNGVVAHFYGEGTLDWATECGLRMLGGMKELAANVQRGRYDSVVLCVGSDAGRIEAFCGMIEGCALEIYQPYELASEFEPRIATMCNVPVTIHTRRPLSDWQRLQKAIFDRLISLLLLVVLSPVLVMIALLIKLDSPGPVLFVQNRVGRSNTLFRCYKFRTMYLAATDLHADRQTSRDDPRVTRTGKWLRKTSLDELPQLLNVLQGDMSLVGPRPHALNTKAEGRRFLELPGYALRHRAKPGITGWSQVNGWRGETTTSYQLEQRVLHDMFYVENWSLGFDIYILTLTVLKGFVSPQAY